MPCIFLERLVILTRIYHRNLWENFQKGLLTTRYKIPGIVANCYEPVIVSKAISVNYGVTLRDSVIVSSE